MREHEYLRGTRQHYQDSRVAQEYFDGYQGKFRLRNIKKRAYFLREQKLVFQLTPRIRNARVLDMACGTGKLFPVFNRLNFEVCAADISAQMIARIPKCYPQPRELRIMDAAAIRYPDGFFDIVFCIRLFHRVPDSIKQRILSELTRVSKGYVLLTVGIETPVSRINKLVLQLLHPGYNPVPNPISKAGFERMLAERGLRAVRKKRLWPFSAEVFYLVKKNE